MRLNNHENTASPSILTIGTSRSRPAAINANAMFPTPTPNTRDVKANMRGNMRIP